MSMVSIGLSLTLTRSWNSHALFVACQLPTKISRWMVHVSILTSAEIFHLDRDIAEARSWSSNPLRSGLQYSNFPAA